MVMGPHMYLARLQVVAIAQFKEYLPKDKDSEHKIPNLITY